MARRLTTEDAITRLERAAYSTSRPDRRRTEEAIATLYEGAGLDAPTVVWGASPKEACRAADEMVGPIACTTLPGDRELTEPITGQTEDEITHIILPWPSAEVPSSDEDDSPRIAYPDDLWHAIGFGHGLRNHPAHIETFRRWDDVDVRVQWAMVRFVENVGWWRFHRTHAFVSQRPAVLALDHMGRPHSMTGPAVVFRDGWSVYAVDGLRLPPWTVEDPERITADDIDLVENAELRRVLVTLAGDRYIEDRGSLVHTDTWGELWSVPEIDGRFLRVTDATPLPDGTRKRYWLRVPENHDTAHGAVAWTFGLTADSYMPGVET